MDYLMVYTWFNRPTGIRGVHWAYFTRQSEALKMLHFWNDEKWEYKEIEELSRKVTLPDKKEYYPKVYGP